MTAPLQKQPMNMAKIQAGAVIAYELVASMREANFNTHEIAQSLVAVAIDVMVNDLSYETAREYFAHVAISIDEDHPLSEGPQSVN